MLLLDISPVAFRIFGVEIYWYGIFYATALLASWATATLLLRILRKQNIDVPSKQQFDSFMFWAIIWTVIGSRIGHIIFFEPLYYTDNPKEIFLIRNGGLAFHGGFIALAIFTYNFCKKYKFSLKMITDILSFSAAIGIFIGRLANFFNQELYGKVSTADHAVIFNLIDTLPRHPTQIYESLSEGLLNFIIMIYIWGLSRGRAVGSGIFTAVFCIVYAVSRFAIEFFKDVETYTYFNAITITVGQILSIFMLVIGILMLCVRRQQEH